MAEAEQGRVGSAIDCVRHAVALDPQGAYRAQLARLLVLVRRDGEAAEVLRAAEARLPQDALGRDTMGCVYARLGDHAASLPHFAAAVQMAPGVPAFRLNHATALNFLGKVDEAEAALEALVALSPGDAKAHHLLASLRTQTAERNHVQRLERTRDAARDPQARLLLGYALSKELEDLGERQAAFARLAEANAEHRRSLPYDFGRDAANFDAIERCWAQVAAASVVGAAQEAPIFVIGMPRTGTTLVDRILSSHPDVESAGELQAMPLAVKAASGTRTRTVLDVETVALAAQADLAAIGRDYLARAQSHLRTGKPRFTDKFPGNFQFAGFIAGALPNARIVCLRRHPLDTILANFRNLFAISSRYYDYSYDLMDIARYYVRFDRMIALWRKAVPGRVLEVQYEALVAQPEAQIRQMLAHCGLDWADECLSFHRNSAPVSTPSAAQVRRPIYSDSVARWKHHRAALEPVIRLLEDAGIPLAEEAMA
ncbi:tetratricopeptide repeat-containing sulfotransferase family protein [Novosphingobium cyanobacteriorum]|uniref:Sulfotransferase n=1 Tax=Novosphingobium cyanobacteriorum TaxID=3024215 RepID=A0ABT6CCT4_9SPHN|nr:tetratricopeptide repeat-containing sulfotransferase family protein [Novosphingobium cyanobacteriorum]MDF8331747.1 sulfotransferase [Novosphingobium cyanobacteriorum]